VFITVNDAEGTGYSDDVSIKISSSLC